MDKNKIISVFSTKGIDSIVFTDGTVEAITAAVNAPVLEAPELSEIFTTPATSIDVFDYSELFPIIFPYLKEHDILNIKSIALESLPCDIPDVKLSRVKVVFSLIYSESRKNLISFTEELNEIQAKYGYSLVVDEFLLPVAKTKYPASFFLLINGPRIALARPLGG